MHATRLRPIGEVAALAGIPADAPDLYGRYKTKVSLDFVTAQEGRPDSVLMLVTGINPTVAGDGRITTTLGLGGALNRVGRRTMLCLRGPSLGLPPFSLGKAGLRRL